ncbi:hypothetical protein C7M84_004335 [Penaeus vannamei]|uniref:Uncharacterized protein n=1 Tax=Penaeus vannamei TaxID=6689 RepID=A0A423TKR7_PENVA|nr:hypothetical protein C7M84_004335 [Penaeus vannamei]
MENVSVSTEADHVYQMGWVLRIRRKPSGMSDRQLEFFTTLYDEGERTARKRKTGQVTPHPKKASTTPREKQVQQALGDEEFIEEDEEMDLAADTEVAEYFQEIRDEIEEITHSLSSG